MIKSSGQILVETLFVVGMVMGSLFLYLKLTQIAWKRVEKSCDRFEAERLRIISSGISKLSCSLGRIRDVD